MMAKSLAALLIVLTILYLYPYEVYAAPPSFVNNDNFVAWSSEYVKEHYKITLYRSYMSDIDECNKAGNIDDYEMLLNSKGDYGLHSSLATEYINSSGRVVVRHPGEPHTYVWLMQLSKGNICYPIYTGSLEYITKVFWIDNDSFLGMGFNFPDDNPPRLLIYHVEILDNTYRISIYYISHEDVKVTIIESQ